jgi:hypothetical protein
LAVCHHARPRPVAMEQTGRRRRIFSQNEHADSLKGACTSSQFWPKDFSTASQGPIQQKLAQDCPLLEELDIGWTGNTVHTAEILCTARTSRLWSRRITFLALQRF